MCVYVCVCVCAANKLRDELFSNCGASEADWRVPRKSSRSNGALVCHRVDARRCVCCMDCLRCTQPKQFCWAVSHTGLSLSYLLTYLLTCILTCTACSLSSWKLHNAYSNMHILLKLNRVISHVLILSNIAKFARHGASRSLCDS